MAENRIFDAVNREVVDRQLVTLGQPFELAPGVTAEPFAVPGKVPLFMDGETVDTELEGEQTIGVALSAGGATAYYIPGCAKLMPKLADRLTGAEMVIFDGTVWLNGEMAGTGVGQKTGARMGAHVDNRRRRIHRRLRPIECEAQNLRSHEQHQSRT